MKRLLFTTLIALSLTASAQVPDYVPEEGLIAWYALDGNATDLSGSENNGSLHGPSPAENRFGQSESCLEFNREELDYISTDIDDIEGDGGRSMAFWARVDEGRQGGFALSYGPELFQSSCNAGFHIDLGPGDCGFVGLGAGANCYQRREPFDNLYDNSWHHFVITYSGGGLASSGYWIDGELQPQTGCLDGSFPSSLNTSALLGMSIGRRNDDNLGTYFDGLIDEVGVWSRELTPSEIGSLFNAEAPATGCTSLEACNFNPEANVDDGSCLYLPETSLIDNIEVTSDGILIVNVPNGLNEWVWNDGSSASTIDIAPFQEYSLTGMIGEAPEVGQLLDEGVVFHVDTESQTALIASPTSIGEGVEWGCKFVTTGATGGAIGDGAQNTALILEACGDEEAAARVASNYGEGWFLPSMAELAAIYENAHITGQGDYFVDNTYNWFWSSTECATNGTAAGDIFFQNGDAFECNNKDSNPGGVIAAKLLHYAQCTYTDSLYIELGTLPPFCGEGTYWDTESQNCVIANPSDTNFDGCVSMTDLLDLLSVFGTCNEIPWSCGDPLEYQGYDYETVQIGEQCWFAENLRAENYRNGDPIEHPVPGSELQDMGYSVEFGSDGFWCTEGNQSLNSCDPEVAVQEFGRLYNGFSSHDDRSLCPSGWHIPNHADWFELAEFSGGQGIAGQELKATVGWNNSANGADSFGWKAKPAGTWNQHNTASFQNSGSLAWWWSSSMQDGVQQGYVSIGEGDFVYIGSGLSMAVGASVRCIQD